MEDCMFFAREMEWCNSAAVTSQRDQFGHSVSAARLYRDCVRPIDGKRVQA